LPKIAAEVAAPLTKANKITMISDGNGEIGAAKITDEVINIVKTIPKVVTAMTGVEILKHSHKK